MCILTVTDEKFKAIGFDLSVRDVVVECSEARTPSPRLGGPFSPNGPNISSDCMAFKLYLKYDFFFEQGKSRLSNVPTVGVCFRQCHQFHLGFQVVPKPLLRKRRKRPEQIGLLRIHPKFGSEETHPQLIPELLDAARCFVEFTHSVEAVHGSWI